MTQMTHTINTVLAAAAKDPKLAALLVVAVAFVTAGVVIVGLHVLRSVIGFFFVPANEGDQPPMPPLPPAYRMRPSPPPPARPRAPGISSRRVS